MTEQNIVKGHRYLVQLSIKQDSFMLNMWDYVESVKTLKEAEVLCDGLHDKTVHKLQISDLAKNNIVRTWV
ncbi:hypothetical protein [Tenacibaculum piscium]|uniref:hypothetical protein n=1 Tax=Tenacibaculum piscium TaxID=1458515 RepID=UPI001F227DAD|nr:hypothetical protein [Tenacibaculum piscium]